MTARPSKRRSAGARAKATNLSSRNCRPRYRPATLSRFRPRAATPTAWRVTTTASRSLQSHSHRAALTDWSYAANSMMRYSQTTSSMRNAGTLVLAAGLFAGCAGGAENDLSNAGVYDAWRTQRSYVEVTAAGSVARVLGQRLGPS